MKSHFLALLTAILICHSTYSQMHNIYKDVNANNEIRNFSFYQPHEGYVAFDQWLGYTVDSGHSFVRKYVTLSNVDYNGYSVNLTFGFDINGVHAFNKDTLLLCGDYGLVPSILYSTNGGNTFKLVNQGDGGTYKKIIFTNANTGYALHAYTIWKTADRGKTWSKIFTNTSGELSDLKNYGNNFIAILGPSYIRTSTNGGASWSTLNTPDYGTTHAFDFIDPFKMWVTTNRFEGTIYYSANGGASWTPKNSSSHYPIGSGILKFVNDSIGYFADSEFDIYKTTDAGSKWEKLPRDTAYTYLGYTHNDLYFYNNQQFWAGGGHGYLEITNNSGGISLPNAQFIIYRGYAFYYGNGQVELTNMSKQGPGYSYKWYKNNVLISTNPNTSYYSDRNYIDTISLVVIKNGITDTATQTVDTRSAIEPCVADFTVAQSDTGRVAFTSTYQDVGRRHFWYFGDGTVDSVSVDPVHFYNAVGTYIVKHRIYNTISHCGDSTTATITINRVQACLRVNISAVPDTFFTNKVAFAGSYDAAAEIEPTPVTTPINWSFGNGTSVTNTLYQTVTYNSSGVYNVCLSLQNKYTGCISQICKPITITLDTCTAIYIINPNYPAGSYVSSYRFEGKKLEQDSGKAHYWIINDRDTISTGNRNYVEKDFYKRGTDAEYFNWYVLGQGNICNVPYTREINIDSLNKKVKHLLIDSITGCTTSVERNITVPTRIKAIQITAVPDPEVSNLVTFYATYQPSGGSARWPYYSIWRKHYTSFSGSYYATDNILMAYNAPGTYNYAVAADACSGDNTREVYSINYKVTILDSCGVKAPKVSLQRFATNPFKIRLYDSSAFKNLILGNRVTIYYGNGDTTNITANAYYDYTYSQSGLYSYIVRATSLRTGCSKYFSGVVEIRCPKPSFTTHKDSLTLTTISFINQTLPDTSNVSYIWRFGNGDSSSLKNPVYTYPQPGVYTVSMQAIFTNGCNFKYDTVMAISGVPCTNSNFFNDSTHTIICDVDSVNLLTFFNTTGYLLQWNTATPQKVGLGYYNMLAIDTNYCSDLSYIKVIQDTAIFTGAINTDWHNPANWLASRLPNSKSHVIIKTYNYSLCILSMADVFVASLQIMPNRTLQVKNNRKVTLTASCTHLPYVTPF